MSHGLVLGAVHLRVGFRDVRGGVTIWQAASVDEAIALAETEAGEYIENVGRYVGLAQSFEMFFEPCIGAEIFSLIRFKRS